MPITLTMPALSPTMTDGTLARWLVQEGDEVNVGDVIAEIETDKATMEVEAVDEGRVGRILVSEGSSEVPVSAPIAVLLLAGESADEVDKALSDSPVVQTSPAEVQHSAPPSVAEDRSPVSLARGENSAGTRLKISPLARRLVRQQGLDVSQLVGSGPHGRIVKRDVEQASLSVSSDAGAEESDQKASSRSSGATGGDDLEPPRRTEKITTMRKVIAERLTHSKQTVPHYYLAVDVELDRALAFRSSINQGREKGDKVSVNDILIKALASALVQVPEANAQWTDAQIIYFERVDVSVAVAIPSGLITPVVRGANLKGLDAISSQVKDLATRARKNKLAPHEFQGGTVSLSNLGMFGVDQFSAVINPPQGLILAVGQASERPVVRDGALAVATVMTATMALDHRVIDGAVGAKALSTFRALIEEPARMLL